MVSTLAGTLPAAARKHGDRTALVIDDCAFSFRQLEGVSNRIANGLVSIGAKPGDRVSLFGANSWEWVASYYGIAPMISRCHQAVVRDGWDQGAAEVRLAIIWEIEASARCSMDVTRPVMADP